MRSRFIGWMILAGAFLSSGAYCVDDAGSTPSRPLGDMTLHVIPQSHIDLAWWWRYDPETVRVIVSHTLETAFGNFEKFPEYTFTYLQVPAIEPLETSAPELFYKLRYYAHSPRLMGERIPNPGAGGVRGRLAIGSGLWCEVDGCVPCGESLVRQCLYGKRYFEKNFGIDVKTAWFQDAWTHPWTYPQILKKSGMDSYMFTRPRGEGEPMFWWEGPDGSRVFAYKPFESGGESLGTQEALNQRLSEVQKRYGVKDDITLIGVGNHGGGAIRADVERMKAVMAQWSTDGLMPKMQFSTPERFISSVLAQPHDFPIIRDELSPTIRGAYTSVGEIKRGNRYAENLLLTLEKFSSIADRMGVRAYPSAFLHAAWEKVMLNQFHDTISGTDIPTSIDDALRRYAEIEQGGRDALQTCLGAICGRINTAGKGAPVVVFNPMGWDRTDIATVAVDFGKRPDSVILQDEQGTVVPVQVLCEEGGAEKTGIRLIFTAQSVPSLGYRTYWASPGHPARSRKNTLSVSAAAMENEYFRVNFDATGCLAGIYDKQQKRQVLAPNEQGNVLHILDDFGDSEGFLKSPEGREEHNVWTGPCALADAAMSVRVLEEGPVRAVVEVKKAYGLARFTQRIMIYAGIARVDFDLVMDWEGKNKMVKVSFPLSVSSPSASYEIPYGTITRPSRGEEAVAQNWVDISEGGYGVSLLNDSRYGHDITSNTIRLSVLRSPDAPVSATEEGGVHTVRYSLYPHAGDWRSADTARRGHEFNNPLIAVSDMAHAGDLPAVLSFVRVTPEPVLLTVLKKAEDSEDLILRCYESEGQSCAARVTWAKALAVDAVHAVNLLEKSEASRPVTADGFEMAVGAYSIESFKLIRD